MADEAGEVTLGDCGGGSEEEEGGTLPAGSRRVDLHFPTLSSASLVEIEVGLARMIVEEREKGVRGEG